MQRLLVSGCVLLACSLSACNSTVHAPSSAAEAVQQPDTGWYDGKARIASSQLIRDTLNAPWLTVFTQQNRRRPVLALGDVNDLTGDSIKTDPLEHDLKRMLATSDRIKLADLADRSIIGADRSAMNEKEADFRITCKVTRFTRTDPKMQKTYYQLNLLLITVPGNHIIWEAQQPIYRDSESAR